MMKLQLKLLVVGSLLLGMTQAFAQSLYRWVDDEGQVHYSDHVPQAASSQDHQVLNQQGVAIRNVEGAATEEELAERTRLAVLAEAEAQAAEEQAHTDSVLLETYLSVEEIVSLRDRRLELLSAQVLVTEQYIENLTQRLGELHQTASNFKPLSDNPNARDMPEYLELDISRTTASIELYQETLGRTRTQQEGLTESFARDIERFRQLTGS